MIGEMINCNPSVKLKKGDSYPLIDMEKITVGNKYVTSEEFAEYSGQSSSKFSNGDTLLARITPCLENGKVAQCKIDGSGFGSTELFVFRGIPGKTDNDYVYYLMSSKYIRDMATNSMTGASGRQRADLGFIKRIKWDFPDMPTQKQIVRKLKNYDDLIELNNKRIKLLEQTAQEIYKEWFIRFRFPDYERAEFDNGIPADWEYKKFSDICSFVRGISYSSEQIEDENAPYILINLKNIRDYGGFRKENFKTYNGVFKPEQKVSKNDLVMAVTEMVQERRIIGYVGLIPSYKRECVISADLIKIVSNIDNRFLYSMFVFGGASHCFSQYGNGTNVIHLKPSSLKNIKLLLPREELINRYVDTVKYCFEEIDSLQLKNENLIKQRDYLLPRLMSGKLEVKQ